MPWRSQRHGVHARELVTPQRTLWVQCLLPRRVPPLRPSFDETERMKVSQAGHSQALLNGLGGPWPGGAWWGQDQLAYDLLPGLAREAQPQPRAVQAWSKALPTRLPPASPIASPRSMTRLPGPPHCVHCSPGWPGLVGPTRAGTCPRGMGPG